MHDWVCVAFAGSMPTGQEAVLHIGGHLGPNHHGPPEGMGFHVCVRVCVRVCVYERAHVCLLYAWDTACAQSNGAGQRLAAGA